MSTAVGLKGAPIAWVFMTVAGVLAGQMIYRWRKDIILTTVCCVALILVGIGIGTVYPSDKIIGSDLANSRILWAILAFAFCYFGSVLPIWRFALPINYVASYIVFLGSCAASSGSLSNTRTSPFPLSPTFPSGSVPCGPSCL